MVTKCAVSGVEIEVNEATLRSTYNGKEYFLCCDDCFEEFNQHPEKYAG